MDPGLADVTADVDFAYLKQVLEKDGKVVTFGPVEQGTFLKNMEAQARLEALLAKCVEDQKEELKTGYDMLVNPAKMGQRFKFLSFFPSVLKDHLKKFPVNGF